MVLDRLLDMMKSGEAARLRVLDRENDPFWVLPSRLRDAKWISEVWRNKVKRRIHDRGLHYILLSLNVDCPWGENRRKFQSSKYLNVRSDFTHLCDAIKDARNWGLLPWDAIEDCKHVGLEKWVDWRKRQAASKYCRYVSDKPFIDFSGSTSYELGVGEPYVGTTHHGEISDSDFEEIMADTMGEFLKKHLRGIYSTPYQPYYLAVASEKSGLREPINKAREQLKYGFDFLNFEGQPSATRINEFLQNRLLGNAPSEHPIRNKKIRIFYISDYDAAGRTMVPAFIQKLMFNLWSSGEELDVKVKALALTPAIIKKYDLPPAPVSARKLGAKTLQDRWLRQFGKIVEVDSLVALHPNALEKIIVDELSKYFDPNVQKVLTQRIQEIEKQAIDAVGDGLVEKKEEWRQARAELQSALKQINQLIDDSGVTAILEKLRRDIKRKSADLGLKNLVARYHDSLGYVEVQLAKDFAEIDFKSDFVAEPDTNDGWLFDSSRDMAEQARILREYKP